MGIHLALNKKIIFSAILTTLCFAGWIYTFRIEVDGGGPAFINQISDVLSLRLLLLLIGGASGLYSFVNFIVNQYYSLRALYTFQVISICAGLLSYLTLFTYIPHTNRFVSATNQITVAVGLILVAICLFTLPFGLIIAIQRRKSLLLSVISLVVSAYYVLISFGVLVLVGIGFGPPS